MRTICIACVTGLPLPPSKGGAVETLVQQIVDENEKNPQFNIVVLTTKDEESEAKARGYRYTKYVRFRRHLWRNRFYFRYVKAMNMLGRKHIQFISGEKKESTKYLMKNHHKFDLIIDEGGVEEFVYGDKIIPFDKRVLHMHGIDQSSVKNASKVKYVFCISHFCTEQWISETGMKKENVYDLINFLNTDELRRKPDEGELTRLREVFEINDDTFVLLFSGRLIAEKGLLELIQAVNLIDDANLLLIVLGGAYYSYNKETPYIKQCRQLANASRSRVLFTGYVDHGELFKYHALADAAVVPSRWEEPAGLVILEAQGAGNAVIATDAGGIPEVLGEGCGILVRNDDAIVDRLKKAILEFMNHPELCRSSGEAGIQYSMEHDGTGYFMHFCELVNSIVSRNEETTIEL